LSGCNVRPVLAESLRQDPKKPLGILLALEQHDEIVGVTDHLGLARKRWLNVPHEPFVEHRVQVDVGEQG
jgi:hypothetical protein